LFEQRRVGVLQLLVALKQQLHAFGKLVELIELVLVRHDGFDCRVYSILPRRIRFVGARGVVHMLQFNGKQGGVKAMRSRFTPPRKRQDL
jgi:hypothetical protein